MHVPRRKMEFDEPRPDEEIHEAVAYAAYTRHWSTIANGALLDFEAFKTEWDGILAHIKKQSEAKDTTKK